MKKEERAKAATLFLQSGGKAGNKEIADKLGVHPLTVERWKKHDNWAAKLGRPKPKTPAVKGPAVVRKKSKLEEALKLYLKSGGQITNKALATKAGVSAATISKWKDAGKWTTQVKKTPVWVPAALEAVEKEVVVSSSQGIQPVEEIEIDIEQLTFPEHITVLNKRMDEMLGREYLTPLDLKAAAEAKEALLKAVSAYIEVLEKISED